MKLMFKYNVDSRGREGSMNTWIIYQDIDKVGLDNPVLTDHIEFDVPISTEEKESGFGFGMFCEGKIVKKMNPLDGQMYIQITGE